MRFLDTISESQFLSSNSYMNLAKAGVLSSFSADGPRRWILRIDHSSTFAATALTSLVYLVKNLFITVMEASFAYYKKESFLEAKRQFNYVKLDALAIGIGAVGTFLPNYGFKFVKMISPDSFQSQYREFTEESESEGFEFEFNSLATKLHSHAHFEAVAKVYPSTD